MGLDTIEIVLRCEEIFGVSLPDAECGQVITVSDLYQLICRHLSLVPMERPETGVGDSRLRGHAVLNLRSIDWTAENVWATLVTIFVDQLQIEADEVKWWARINADLGCD